MRVLILGGGGMLGHKMHEVLAKEHEVTSTVRRPLSQLPVDPTPFFGGGGEVIEGLDVADIGEVRALIAARGPDAVINCVGIVKQRDEAHRSAVSIEVNALFPHLLAEACAGTGARLIHFGTDCVFSGDRGRYTEDDVSDARDLYGRTKFLGEVVDGDVLTLRSSIIGRELDHFASLVEWFLRQEGEVPGFTRVIYSGITTERMARLVNEVLTGHRDLRGLYQVASQPISKFELLAMLRNRCGLADRIDLMRDDSVVSDRSLAGDRFEEATGIAIDPWDRMLDEFAEDVRRYARVKL